MNTIGQNRPTSVRIPWKGQETPGKLLVQWQDKQAFWPVNVENEHDLPLAREIESIIGSRFDPHPGGSRLQHGHPRLGQTAKRQSGR